MSDERHTAPPHAMATRGAHRKPELESLAVPDCGAWHRWLEEHHDRSRGIWLVFNKKHTGHASLTYPEARDEALCFGWIDSIVKRVDENRYMQKFTPRTNAGKWSELNLSCMRRLIREGRMTEAGLRVLGVSLEPTSSKRGNKRDRAQEVTVPDFMNAAISSSRKASDFWGILPPSCRRRYIAWVKDAKRTETRARRVQEAVKLLEAGTRNLLK